MGFTSTDPQNHQSENIWFTPKEIIDGLGPFDLDPCTVSYAPFKTAKNVINYDMGNCGIKTKWYGDVWLNPPYGKEIIPFVDKFINHKLGIMLVFARMDSISIQKLINQGAYIYCLRKRIKFINKNGKKLTNAGTGSCFIFFDNKYIQKCNQFEGILLKKD